MKLTVEGENPFYLSSRPTSLLERSHPSFHGAFSLSALQKQVDGIAEGFISQATDWKSLAALMAGGMAYRLGRMGAMSLGSGNAVRFASVGFGLTAEVSAFEGVHRGLLHLRAGLKPAPTDSLPPTTNLFRWSGPGGLKEGLYSSFIAFGTLKGLGRLTEGQNLVLQHVSQDLGLVLGHQLAYGAGIGSAPAGTLAEQLLRAEATNLQVSAAAALGHGLMGGELYAMERGQDLAFSAGRGPRNSALESLLGKGAPPLKTVPVFLAAQDAGLRASLGAQAAGKVGENPLRGGRMRMNISTEQGLLIAAGILGATAMGSWLVRTLMPSRSRRGPSFYTLSGEERELLKPFFPAGVPPKLRLGDWEGINQRVYDEACDVSPRSGKGLNLVIKNQGLYKLYFQVVAAKLEHLNSSRKLAEGEKKDASEKAKPLPSGPPSSPKVEAREIPIRSGQRLREDQETLFDPKVHSPPKKN